DAGAAVRFVRFDPTGSHLLVGAYDATLRAYRTADWQVDREFRAPFQWERAACYITTSSLDASVAVASFGAAPVFHIGGTPAGPDLPTFGINALGVREASSDGGEPAVLVGRDDGRVIDTATGHTVAQHESIVNTVAISSDGRMVASGDYRGRLTVSDRMAGIPLWHADVGAPINSAVWSHDGTTLYGAGYDGMIRSWTAAGELRSTHAAHHSPIKSLAYTAADGGLVIAGSSDGSLSAWSGDAEAWRARGDGMVLVNSVAISAETAFVVSASRDLHLRRWDVRTGELVERLPRVHDKSIKV
ncbi:MAG TPA: hypothetical protein PLV68_10565, partial [Ilumatobacteraceae bacterium]|nr:hypothetical protein [Ilumatobacteraceae bacterium]